MKIPDVTRPRRTATTQVDPRIADRRRQVSDEAAHRRLRMGGAAAGVAALAAAVAAALFSPVLDVDRVSVIGSHTMSGADVMAAGRVGTGDAMITVDSGEIERRLAADARVARVSVIRRWPGTVEVRITDRVPALRLVSGERSRMVSADGYVVMDGEAPAGDGIWDLEVPALSRSVRGDREPAALRRVIEVASAMPNQVAYFVRSMSLQSDGDLHLELRGGGVVEFGPPDQAGHKFVAIASMLGGRVPLEGMCRLDVTDPFAVGLTRTPFCDPVATAPTAPAPDDTVDGDSTSPDSE